MLDSVSLPGMMIRLANVGYKGSSDHDWFDQEMISKGGELSHPETKFNIQLPLVPFCPRLPHWLPERICSCCLVLFGADRTNALAPRKKRPDTVPPDFLN